MWKLLIVTGFIFSPLLSLAQEPIKVGAILHLTGDLAMQGKAFRDGIELGLKVVNSQGGVDGRSLKVIYEDTHFNPANVHRASKKLLHTDKVVASLISTFHESKTAGPLFERARVPLLCLWDSNPELEDMGDYIFSIGTWMPSTSSKTSAFAYNKLKARKAAVISTNREWSLRVGNAFEKKFTELGGTIVSKQSYNPGETDFRTMQLRMKQSAPDVLYAPVDDNIAAFFKQLKASGFNKPVIQSDNLNQEWIETLGPVLEGVYQSHSIDPDHLKAQELAKLFVEHYGMQPTQLLLTAWGYDSIFLLAEAMRGNSATSAAIQSGLYQVQNFSGASGVISISPQGSSRVQVSMFKIQDRKFSLSEP